MASPDDNPWVRYRNATLAADHNHISFALAELAELYTKRSQFPHEFVRQLAYSYGVVLIMAHRWKDGIAMLSELRSTLGKTAPLTVLKDIAKEIAFAHIVLGDVENGRREAEIAISAEEQLTERDPIPYYHLGLAELKAGQADAAYRALLQSLEISAAIGRTLTGANTILQLGRAALMKGLPSDAVKWADYAERLLAIAAPHRTAEAEALRREAKGNVSAISDTRAPEGSRFADALLAGRIVPMKTEALCAMDIDLWGFLSACGLVGHEVGYEISITADDRASRLAQALVSEIEAIEPHHYFHKFVAESFVARHLGLQPRQVPLPNDIRAADINLSQPNDANSAAQFTWYEKNSWPAAFGPLLQTLAGIFEWGYDHGREHSKARQTGWSDLDVLPFDWRALPRRIYVRYASDGAFASGGAAAPYYMFERLLRESLKDRSRNVAALMAMSYARPEAEELATSGLLGLRASGIGYVDPGKTSEKELNLGGVSVDEVHAENLPNSPWIFRELPESEWRYGWIVDTHYQAPFWGRAVGNYALYGARSDYFHPFYSDFVAANRIIGSVRAKHHAIPVIEVGSFDQIKTIVDSLPRHPESSIVFRGQDRAYPLERTEAAKRLLFGSTEVVEPSLPGAAPRKNLDYEQIHSTLSCLVQDHLYERTAACGQDLSVLHERWEERALGAGEWDVWVMALAQHYGIPTNGIDVTSSLHVAVWFATNILKCDESEAAWYERMMPPTWNSNRDAWPVLYVIQPLKSRIFDSLRQIDALTELGLGAPRPERQHALFFMGADTIDKNRLAEALACVLVLRPGVYETGLTYEHLFPNRGDDEAYDFLLHVRERVKDQYLWEFFRHIAVYK